MRPKALQTLLNSVDEQTLYPNEIIIVDGSLNNGTSNLLENNSYKNLKYFLVDDENRGLTRQRNYGIKIVSEDSEIICFLDDDVVLEANYFKNLIKTYKEKPDAIAVGGYIKNEVVWERAPSTINSNKFYYDGWMRNEPSRFKLRRKFGLSPDNPPGFLPTFAHGRSIGFFPPSGKIYTVEFLMGCSFSFKTSILNKINFSTYFQGYGLYEDLEFCLRVSKLGKIYVNTSAELEHFHDEGGRPNKFKYGKMVVRNGWYVWRVKYPNPKLKARIKWNATAFLLTVVRLSNVINSSQKKQALSESFGRLLGWFSLIFNKPKIN
jgi:GT2 family glycosyltransferase